MTSGNTVTLLQNGDDIFPAMLEAIASARQRIDFCTYVYWKSAIASRFAQALAERARAGVTVRLIIDDARFHLPKIRERISKLQERIAKKIGEAHGNLSKAVDPGVAALVRLMARPDELAARLFAPPA
jgi:phosphatidylserine/phosphatidylglycerophosphate/cardiolipin synthase-like enzyme